MFFKGYCSVKLSKMRVKSIAIVLSANSTSYFEALTERASIKTDKPTQLDLNILFIVD